MFIYLNINKIKINKRGFIFRLFKKNRKKLRISLGIQFDVGFILLIRYVKMFREIYLRKVYERGMFK